MKYYNLPKYREIHLTRLPKPEFELGFYQDEIRDVFKKNVDTLTTRFQSNAYRPEFDRKSKYGNNLPLNNLRYEKRTALRYAHFVGRILNQRCREVPVYSLICTEPISEVRLNNSSTHDSLRVHDMNNLRDLLSYFLQFDNLDDVNWNKIDVNKIEDAIVSLSELDFSMEMTINAALLNVLVAVTYHFRMICMDKDMTLKVKYERYDLMSAYIATDPQAAALGTYTDHSLEDIFKAYLMDIHAKEILNYYKDIGSVNPGDLSNDSGIGLNLNEDFYHRMIDKAIESLTDRTSDLYIFMSNEKSFAEDRIKYAQYHRILPFTNYSHDVDKSLLHESLSIGFINGQNIDMKKSKVIPWLEEFTVRYKEIIPLWSEFVDKFFLMGQGYFFFSSQIRTSIEDGKRKITHINLLSPYLRNAVVWKRIEKRYKKVEEYGVVKTSMKFDDPYPLKSYRQVYIQPGMSDLFNLARLYGRHSTVVQDDPYDTKFSILYSNEVRFVIPPRQSVLEYQVLDKNERHNGHGYSTVVKNIMDESKVDAVDLFFLVRDSDQDNLENLYKKRISLLGSEYSIGNNDYISDFPIDIISMRAEALYYATFSRLASDLAIKSISTELNMNTLGTSYHTFDRWVTLPLEQKITVPTSIDNIDQVWWNNAPLYKGPEAPAGARGTERFWVSMNSFNSVIANTATVGVTLFLDRDISIPYTTIMKREITKGDNPAEVTFLLSPNEQLDQRVQFLMSGPYTIYDYIQAVEYDNSLNAIIKILMSLLVDTNIDKISLSAKVQGVCNFIEDNLNEEGSISECDIVKLNKTWKDLKDHLRNGMESDGTYAYSNYFKAMTSFFQNTSLISDQGFKYEYPIFGDTKLILEDIFLGINRGVQDLSTVNSLNSNVSLPGLFTKDPVLRMTKDIISRRVHRAVIDQIHYQVHNSIKM